jgi:hypothetical protein
MEVHLKTRRKEEFKKNIFGILITIGLSVIY